LLNEIDDFIHVVNGLGIIQYASPSIASSLDRSPDSVIGKPVSDIIMPDDVNTMGKYLTECLNNHQPFLMYLRYFMISGEFKLFEVRGNYYTSSDTDEKLVVLAARKYSSKSTQSLDTFVELQTDSFQLNNALEAAMLAKGQDPFQSELLGGQQDPTLVDDFTEAFLFDRRSLGGTPEIGVDFFSISGLNDAVQQAPIVQLPKEKVALKKTPKRKRGQVADLFCLQCGTTSSPEWRAGPEGPKTLCNACGLAYYKKNRKLRQNQNKADQSSNRKN